MSEEIRTACAQLDEELKNISGLSQNGGAVKNFVVDVLKEFCRQNEEFARAVSENRGKLKECIEITVKNCGSCISDNEVYKRAAQFYFPGSVIEFKMILHMSKFDMEENSKGGAVSFDLDKLLDI